MKPCRKELIELLHAVESHKSARARSVCELLRRLLLASSQPEHHGWVSVTMPLKRVANLEGMPRYSIRSVRTWCEWAKERDLLKVQVVTNGDGKGNSYAINASRLRQLAASIDGRTA
jgi:hypothetical protein